MKYVLLIYVDEAVIKGLSEEDRAAYFQQWGEYEGHVQATGMKTGGEPLQPIGTATSVRVRDEENLITDGPFAETKEQLAGFYVLECENLDQALEYAAKMPDAKYGTIEVRPVFQKY
ncbi:MAG: YciI family protein [Chloroflexota bacterium]